MRLKLLADKISLYRNVHKFKTHDIYSRLTLDEKTIALVCYRCFIPVKWVSLTGHLVPFEFLKFTGGQEFYN